MPDLRRRTIKGYSRLDCSTHEIRVLWIERDLNISNGLINCQLKPIKIDSRYVCLSYMWGSEKTTRDIHVNNRRLKIGHNLWKFLNLWRQEKAMQPIWIDAICIDQDEIEEKNHQLSMMGEIYQSATEVLVWLGEGDLDIEEALDVMSIPGLKYLIQFQLIKPELYPRKYGSKSFKKALAKIATLPYWGRRWIIQELVLNQGVRCLYGRSQIEIQSLTEFFCECPGSDWCSDHHAYAAGSIPSTKILSFCPWYPHSFYARSLQDLMIRFSSSACSRAYDLIYALIPIAEECEKFEVDYEIPPTEFFMRVLRSAHPNESSPLDSLKYISLLVDCLRIFDSHYGEEVPRLLQENHAPDSWGFRMQLDFFGVLGSSQFRKRTTRNASSCSETNRTASQLLTMIVCGVLGAEFEFASDQEEASNEETDPNDGFPEPLLQRTVRAGVSGLEPRDVFLRIGSYTELSNLFLIGRFCGHRKDELVIVAVAESESPTYSCSVYSPNYADFSGCIGFKIYDTPSCVKDKSISIIVKNKKLRRFGAEIVLSMSSVAQFVNILSTKSSGAEEWSWKSEKMSSMREVTFSEIRQHESRPSKSTRSPSEHIETTKVKLRRRRK